LGIGVEGLVSRGIEAFESPHARSDPSSGRRERAAVLGSPGTPDLAHLTLPDGTTWLDFRRTLTPAFGKVWRQIALCYVLLLGGFAASIVVERRVASPLTLALLVPAALWFGFWLHYLWLFAHESSHWGLATSRRRNDLLANIFIWPWYGHTARGYRLFHWQHHRHLGDGRDSEISYRNCLSAGYVVKLGTGLALLQALRLRGDDDLVSADGDAPKDARAMPSAVTLGSAGRSALLHLVMVAIPLLAGAPVVAVSWILGAVIVYPALNIVRQILEHRSEDARCADDFSVIEHGPITHGFGDGLFARWFGAAGFNRHDLHHWDASVSCTRLADMEAFVRKAGLAGQLDEQERSYWGELRTQLRAARA
jgi:fatty acid desaturase